VAGDANEEQILIAAHVCMDNKQELLQKVLSDLYHVFRYENCHRMDQALCTVLEAMEKHPTQKHIQISGRYMHDFIYKLSLVIKRIVCEIQENIIDNKHIRISVFLILYIYITVLHCFI